MAFELPSRLGFGFSDPIGLNVEGVTLTVATVGSILCIVGAFATNGIDGADWTLGEWAIMGAMAIIIIGFIAVPFIREAIMGSVVVAIVALAIEGIGFALIAYY
jgi:hypothetical protein